MLKSLLAGFGKALLPLALFGAIFFSLTRTPASQTTQDTNRSLHIQVHQLPTRFQDRITLRCDDALLSAPNNVEDVTCYIKNDSLKPVVAGALAIVYLLDDNGKTTSLPALLSFDSLLQPNFLAEHPSGLIAAGSEYRLQNLATDLDRPIKGIVAYSTILNSRTTQKRGQIGAGLNE